MKNKRSDYTIWAETRKEWHPQKPYWHTNRSLQKWLWRQNKTGTKQKLWLWQSCLHVQTYDGLPLNFAISLQIDQLYKSSWCGFFLEKLLARQSCADSWWQHIKGLCGSVVSINGLSFLLSGSSTWLHHYDGAPSYRAPGQTFIGNGIGFKQRYYSYSQHQRWTVSVSCHTY